MLLDMQGQDAVYSWINQGKGPKMAMYELTAEEFETIQAIRKREAQIVLVPKNRRQIDVNIGDIDQDGCRVIEVDWRGGILVSSPLEEEEIEEALKKGAKRVMID